MLSRRSFLTFLAVLFPLCAFSGKPERTLLLNRCYVAGLQYHPGINLRFECGDALKMVRELSSPYDANAVALYAKGVKLGYIPKKENTTLAMLLDQDAPLRVKVAQFDAYAKPWERVEIVVEEVGYDVSCF